MRWLLEPPAPEPHQRGGAEGAAHRQHRGVWVVTIVDRQEGAGAAFAAAGLTLTPILTLEDFK